MKIGLYVQSQGLALGGADVCLAVLAQALGQSHIVDVLRHGRDVSATQIAEFTGTNLSNVRVRQVPSASRDTSDLDSLNPLLRYRTARNTGRTLSAGYDMFIAFVHDAPPFCHARRGILRVLFPMFTPYHRAPPDRGAARLWDRARRTYSFLEWRRRLGSYETVAANSDYTREWIRQLWGVDAVTVYPPAGDDVKPGAKSPIVLSVGRFAAGGHVKCQAELVEAFAGLDLAGWRYVTLGAIGGSPDDQAYAERVREAAAGKPVTVAANLPRGDVRDLYGRARIFWHAAGLTNVADAPENNEHFGLSTVEAMAAGCVPVVINKGGQPEIVDHGVNGFLWNTIEELRHYTSSLARDDLLWSRMSRAAIERARAFDRREYVARFFQLMGIPVSK